MEWYLPLTFLPSLGLIIMSTAHQLMTLSSEIHNLLHHDPTPHSKTIAQKKIAQLERLTLALTLLYFSSGWFTLSGLLQFFIEEQTYGKVGLVFGTGTFFFSLAVLTFYGLKAVQIRKNQFEQSLT